MLDNAIARLKQLTFFDPDWYKHVNSDIGLHNPYAHAINFGAREGRIIFNSQEISRLLSCIPVIAPCDIELTPSPASVDIYVSSMGNVFMDQIADDILRTFNEHGIMASKKTDADPNKENSVTKIVVAPHEFFLLGDGPQFFNSSFMKNCFVYNTEQLQTRWFASALPHILSSAGIIDICYQSARLLSQSGIPTIHWEPSPRQSLSYSETIKDHPLSKSIPQPLRGTRWEERTFDLSFFGSDSPRREKLFSRLSPQMAEWETFIYYRKRPTPLSENADRTLADLASYVAGMSKIYLNVHRDVLPYFEWHRIVRQGIQSGAVVVTDNCLSHPLYKPGVHFIETNTRYIASTIEWALNDPQGIQCCNAILNTNNLLMNNVIHHRNNANVLFNFLGRTTR
ncbi:hypothetical protein ACFOLL_12530 [Falsochrobactrum ovis]|uniref:Glycosyl transferase family 1 n=1 Tax=Falsochrobactrum ovis TaxID=1293442 RepID=A0A364JSX1_9HYPH|nr:hypothetical protein [Falsochrobactrum ovis]RAK26393.1 hypothetical protein C7374_11479 [Falsochrobactrum ovis]